ncbi:hypothetical protein FACS189475_02210 [Betaproteobacteria bacterium]|nr:hypothetical protein FACS189475_02210 [Betaproteobacteria bacterium]
MSTSTPSELQSTLSRIHDLFSKIADKACANTSTEILAHLKDRTRGFLGDSIGELGKQGMYACFKLMGLDENGEAVPGLPDYTTVSFFTAPLNQIISRFTQIMAVAHAFDAMVRDEHLPASGIMALRDELVDVILTLAGMGMVERKKLEMFDVSITVEDGEEAIHD